MMDSMQSPAALLDRTNRNRVRARETPRPPRPAGTTIDSLEYRVVQSRAGREAAFQLVYDAYTASGLIAANPTHMRVTGYHLCPSTAMFLALDRDRPLYTVSLIGDGQLGLPLEEIYASEVAALRSRGLRFAEVSCLAACQEMPHGLDGFTIYVNLIGLMLQYARFHGMHGVVLAVHPRHARFYERFFGCEVFGELKNYDAVNGHPAVGCYHDFVASDQKGYRLRDQIYGVHHAPSVLRAQPIAAEDCEYFAEAAKFAKAGLLPMAA
jgi:hypothetical protein